MPEKLLSERQVRTAKPAAREYLLSDGGSLAARVRATRAGEASISWFFWFKWQGRTERMALGTYPEVGLAEARRRRDAARAMLKAQPPQHPVLETRRRAAEAHAKALAEASERTVRALFEDWRRTYAVKHRKDGGAEALAFFEKDVFPYVGEMKARALTRAQIAELVDRVVARGARRKANAVLALLKQVCAHGVVRGLIDVDPTYGFRQQHAGGRQAARERVLSPAELALLAERLPGSGLSEWQQAAVRLLLATGARVGELNRARWADFELEARTWTIPAENAKNGREHCVHLADFALEALAVLARYRTGPYALPSRSATEPINARALVKALRDRQREKPLPGRSKRDVGSLVLPGGNWSPHDLRRTFATRLNAMGIAPHVVERALNHRLEGVMAVYNQADYLPERRDALESWGAELARIFSRAKGSNVIPIPTLTRRRRSAGHFTGGGNV